MKVEKITYEINWKNFKRGSSFFIPCLNPRASGTIIRQELKRLKLTYVTKIVIENGVRGVRVWRT